jgi:hypothetical protein
MTDKTLEDIYFLLSASKGILLPKMVRELLAEHIITRKLLHGGLGQWSLILKGRILLNSLHT